MDVQEEVAMGSSNDHTHVIKGKRTKRQRSSSPFITTAATSTSSSNGCAGRAAAADDYNSALSSPATASSVATECTEEEEDMAICLIMLAQGTGPPTRKKPDKSVTQKPEISGFYVYECKTCNRSFPSFQALGGHRASHKKPKVGVEEKPRSPEKPPSSSEGGQNGHLSDIGQTTLALQATNIHVGNNNKLNKIHECSVCGSEFTSGQALGGHMRRHRATAAATAAAGERLNQVGTSPVASDDSSKEDPTIDQRKFLPLDLNLPAPEEDLRESKYQAGLVFSAPALVDCHY